MQSGTRLFLARIASGKSSPPSLRSGSRLALEGVYVGRSHGQIANADNESFEVLLNSLADITVLSQSPWWTLPRLFALLGVLVVILIFTVIWNRQLRQLGGISPHPLLEGERESPLPYAAQLLNQRENVPIEIIYGAVTNGFEWLFLRLEKNIFSLS